MKKFLILLVIVMLSGTAFSSDELDFREIKLRMSVSAEPSPLALAQSYKNDPDLLGVDIKCFDEKVQAIVVISKPASSERFIAAVMKKYGKPKRQEDKMYQNAFGANFKGFVASWFIKGDLVQLEYSPYKVEMYATLMLATKEYLDREKKPDIKM